MQTDAEVAAIVVRLNNEERRIVLMVEAGQKLVFATRAEDAFRQRLRRMGVIVVLKNPRRWSCTDLGLRACRRWGGGSGGSRSASARRSQRPL